MMDRYNLNTLSLMVLLVLSISINIFLLYKMASYNKMPYYYIQHEKYINAAFIEWANKEKISVQEAKKNRYAKEVIIGDNVCVSLDMILPSVGGVPVYCFDTKTNKISARYDNVE